MQMNVVPIPEFVAFMSRRQLRQGTLCETEVIAPSRDGLEYLGAELVVALVLRKIKLCDGSS